MKINHFLPMMLCFCFLLNTVGCDKAELQKLVVDNQPVVPRGPALSCEDCPVDDCCCAVQLVTGSGVSFELCGTSSPNVITTPCSDTWGNCPISGFLLPYSLNVPPDLEVFCMPLGSSFRIKSTSGSGTGTVRITCQYGQGATISEDVNCLDKASFILMMIVL